MVRRYKKRIRAFTAVRRYPVMLRELARGGQHLRRTFVFFLMLACALSIPALSYQVTGVPGWLVPLYIGVISLSVVLWVFLTALFVKHTLLPVLSYRAWFGDVYNLMLSLARHVLYAVAVAAGICFALGRFAPDVPRSPVTAGLAAFVLFDATAHFAAAGTRRYAWGLAATAVFLVLFTPAAWLFGNDIWGPLVFRFALLSGEDARAVSVPEGSVVAVDGLFCRVSGLPRFAPVLYTGRSLGGRERCGRVFGLPDERIELDRGDIFNFDTGAVITKPSELQERLWVPVAFEDFDGPRDSMGWHSSTAGWLIRDGMLRVAARKPTMLVFSPRADKKAYEDGFGVTDLEVARAPKPPFRSPSGLPFPPLPANFRTDRTAEGRLRYWGIFPSTGMLFCARCGTPWPHPVVEDERRVCSQCGARMPDGLVPPLFELRGGENPVYDVCVDFTFTLRAHRGEFLLSYLYHDVPVKVRIDGKKGTLSLDVEGKKPMVLPVEVHLNSPLRIRAAFYDGVAELTAGTVRATISLEADLSARPPFRLKFTADGGSFALDDLAVLRDQYYTSATGLYAVGPHSLVKVLPDSFFVLNDQGQDTRDSRSFGCIECSDVKGVPLFVLWPLVFR